MKIQQKKNNYMTKIRGLVKLWYTQLKEYFKAIKVSYFFFLLKYFRRVLKNMGNVHDISENMQNIRLYMMPVF